MSAWQATMPSVLYKSLYFIIQYFRLLGIELHTMSMGKQHKTSNFLSLFHHLNTSKFAMVAAPFSLNVSLLITDIHAFIILFYHHPCYLSIFIRHNVIPYHCKIKACWQQPRDCFVLKDSYVACALQCFYLYLGEVILACINTEPSNRVQSTRYLKHEKQSE